MTARPKTERTIDAICYGEESGMCFEINLNPDQEWIVKKSGRYFWLSRKGCPVRLRLTMAALLRLFNTSHSS